MFKKKKKKDIINRKKKKRVSLKSLLIKSDYIFESGIFTKYKTCNDTCRLIGLSYPSLGMIN